MPLTFAEKNAFGWTMSWLRSRPRMFVGSAGRDRRRREILVRGQESAVREDVAFVERTDTGVEIGKDPKLRGVVFDAITPLHGMRAPRPVVIDRRRQCGAQVQVRRQPQRPGGGGDDICAGGRDTGIVEGVSRLEAQRYSFLLRATQIIVVDSLRDERTAVRSQSVGRIGIETASQAD
jgi:hypothetical protein